MTQRRLEWAVNGATIALVAGVGATALPGGGTRADPLDSHSTAYTTERRLHVVSPNRVAEASRTQHIEAVISTSYPRDISVPILMYHVVGDPPRDVGQPELYVSSEDFAGQMDWLEQRGYSVVTLRAVWDHWQGRGELPARPVVITFDDGTRSIYLRALPELTARGWPGVLNLDLSNLEPSWGIRPGRVRRLVEAGWEIGSHTLTHADLTGLDAANLKREISGSRAEIRRRFGYLANFFCYPSGRFDNRVVAAVEAAGYLGATTTAYGLARRADPYRLARVRVNRSDGVSGLSKKLTTLEGR